MNYESTISLKIENPKELLEIFGPELKDTINNRASYRLKEEKGTLKFIITAKDSVSLRSTLNSITKLLTVYEKIKD